MEELINVLTKTTGLVKFELQEAGLSYFRYTHIHDYELYLDGITLVLDDDAEMYISSVCNTLISKDDSAADVVKYVICTVNKSILSIVIEKT